MSADKQQLITIGKIVKPQGHRGEVRVLPLTDFPERFAGMGKVLLEQQGRHETRHIDKIYAHGKFIIIKFAGVDDMNAALLLKNAVLKVTREELVPLPEDSYYIFDLLGLDVYTRNERYLGKIKDVIQTGANDVYVVEGDNPKPLLLPALKQVVHKIDIQAGKMIVELPAGLE